MNFKTFDEVLRVFLDKKDEKESKQFDNDWWFASELGLCKRKHFLRRLNITPSEPKKFRFRFLAEDGEAAHNWRESAAEEMGIVLARELELKDEELRYSGRLDLLVNLDGKPVIIDIKTQRPESFFRREKMPEDQKVKEHQKMQLASYIYFFNKLYPKFLEEKGFQPGIVVEEGRIYYVDRGGGLRDEYVFANFPEKRFKKVLEELQELNIAWKTQKIPNKTSQTWECKNCPFASICKKVEKGELNFNQLIETYGRKTERDQLGRII